MRLRIPMAILAAGAMALTSAMAISSPAFAARKCGQGARSSRNGSLGTGWTLQSKYDDDGPQGPGFLVVGEEFEINTQAAGQVWTVKFFDNGKVFFENDNDVSTATGIREVHPNPTVHHINSHMTAFAQRHDTGEVINNAAVDLPPAPAACGPLSP